MEGTERARPLPPDRSRGLVVLSEEPFNAETPLERQEGVLTPLGRHYVRCHFPIPRGERAISVDGLVLRRLALSLDDLRAMPAVTVAVTLECAGNGRAFLDPPVAGEQWRLGAVGTAEWTGVSLRDVLERAGLDDRAREVVFRGADEGEPAGLGRRIAFERSLAAEDALRGGALLAYAMNGVPLAPEHGAPVRLVVPGAYGMASVKWLVRIEAVAEPFGGFFQRDRYVIDGLPLGPIAPRAVIVEPRDGATVSAGVVHLRGYCWSGADPVTGVEVRVDDGPWRDADLGPATSPYAWREWELAWDARRGDATLIARARTSSGDRQPTQARRTALGYANNGAWPVHLLVV